MVAVARLSEDGIVGVVVVHYVLDVRAVIPTCTSFPAFHYFEDTIFSMSKGALSRAIFLWQRSIVTETLAKYLRSHTATKSLKENLSKNLC